MDIKPLILLLVSAVPNLLWAEEALKDPYTRDDDISRTTVSVKTIHRSDGMYEYVYTLAGPTENKGIISTFLVDLHCDRPLDPSGLPPSQQNGLIKIGDVPQFIGTQGYNTPVSLSADYGSASSWTVTLDHWAQWGLDLMPGETLAGLRLVSKEPPALRLYQLVPFMDTTGWDYSDEEDPNLPWIPDFTVTGTIAGPACPGVTTPIDEPTFAGTAFTHPAELNQLLTYSAPLLDRWHVANDVASVELKIHYAAEIDAKTFRVEPDWAKKLFHPVPGGSETVVLPLKEAKNIFKLEVAMSKQHPQAKSGEEEAPYKDKDVFEVRRAMPTKGGK